MKNIILIGFFLLSGLIWGQELNQKKITVAITDGTFEELASEIEQQTNLHLLFKEKWFSEWAINLNINNTPLDQLLNQILDTTDIKFSYLENYVVLLPKEELISSLPDYNSRFSDISESDEIEINTSNPFMKGRKADLVQVKIGSSKYPTIGRKVNIKGRINQADSDKGVEGATIYISELKTGAVTNENGHFDLQLPSGKYAAKIECLGMEAINCQLEVISDGSFELDMFKANIDMKELVVYGDRQMSIRDKDPGLEKVNVKAIKELPMMMGESDIIKVSEMLPGIVSVGEGAAGLNVRGGSFDQNAFYFNHIPVYNTSHMFGFFPAFNADVISDFSIYKGYIPAQYGGKISSIFAINTRAGNKKNYTAHGGISPIAGNLTVEGPIKKDTASFLLSGRSSYSDWILRQVKDYVIRNSKASFYDLSASVNYDLPNTQVNLFGYHSQDYFKLHDINTYWYSNSGASANVGHKFRPDLRGDFSLSGSRYQFKTIDSQLESAAYEHEFKVDQYDLRADFLKTIGENHQLQFGLNGVWYQLDRGDVLPSGSESQQSPLALGSEKGLESALYVSDKWQITPLIELHAGFRFSAYSTFGPQKVYTYFDNGPKEYRNINDSILFNSGQAIKWYYFPEFRAALNYQTDEFGSIKLSFNQMHQNIFMLNNTITVAPNSQWKLADYHLQPSRSYQFSLGAFRNLPRGGWEVSAEVYYKSTSNYTEFKDGADFLSTSLVETTVLQGDQKSYGLEFMLKRSGKRLDGWLAYTYSRSFVQVNAAERWNQINNGEVYPSNFDIPHVLNAIINYHISKRVTLSSTITYQTGKPSTFPTGYYFIEGQPYLDYSKRNEYRIPDYFRTDLSLTIEGNLRKKKLLHSSFVFSIYNLTARNNPYSVYFTKEQGRIRSYQYAVIGVPIFTATWIFKLGNYDAK